MSSLLTNVSALTALRTLSSTQKDLQKVQGQISTGLKIGSAADNAAVWSTSEAMKSDNGALGAVGSALSYAGSMLDTFTAAFQQVISVVNNIKNDLVSAQTPGADLSKIQTDIAAQQSGLKSITSGANFNGQNWLSNSGALSTASITSSYDSTNGVGSLSVDLTKVQMVDTSSTSTANGILSKNGANYTGASILTLDVSSATSTDLQNMLKDVDAGLKLLETGAASIGAAKTNVTTQQSFITSLQDSLTAGVGALVDADMNQASTRLQALQTQQSLGVQSLSIANQNTQMILKLFQ